MTQNITGLTPDSTSGSGLSRPTQPFIHPGSVNENQLWLGRQREVWFNPFVDKRVGGRYKLCDPLTMRAIPEMRCTIKSTLGFTLLQT